MTPLYDSQLRELCVALGWQGGTYHQVLAEVKRLAAAGQCEFTREPGTNVSLTIAKPKAKP